MVCIATPIISLPSTKMCPGHNAESAPVEKTEMVPVDTQSAPTPAPIKKRGTSRNPNAHLHTQPRNPYAARASDLISNISNFNIIESTLRGALTCFCGRAIY